MNTFFNWLCNPVVIYIMILVIALFFQIARQNRRAFIFFGLSIFWIVLVSISPFPQWMVHSLERQYPVFDPAKQEFRAPVNILVLGGGHTQEPDMPPSMRLSGTASARLVEGIRLYKRIDYSKLVASGSSLSKRITLAEVESNAAVDLGVNEKDTLQNREPKNTAEEILSYKERFGNEGTLILVTSAFHMPRAMLLCKQYGLKAIPAPTAFYIKNDTRKSLYNFKPSARKMEMMERALHEYAGIIKAKWLD